MQEQETMGIQRAVKRCLTEKYATFSGRASRAEYWWFTLAVFLISIAVAIMEMALFSPSMPGLSADSLPDGDGPVTVLLGLAVFLPGLGVAVRRLHDTGHSGWWVLLGFVPIIGSLVLLWWYISPSQQGANRYGAQPPETFA